MLFRPSVSFNWSQNISVIIVSVLNNGSTLSRCARIHAMGDALGRMMLFIDGSFVKCSDYFSASLGPWQPCWMIWTLMILFRSRNSARLVLFLPSPPTLPFDFALDFPDCEMVCGGDGVDESRSPYCMVRMC